VSERNLMEWERLNEKIVISAAERVAEDGTLNATIQNIGAVTAHLVSLWLSAYNGEGEPIWQRQYEINIWISPGEVRTDFGQDLYTYILVKPGQAGEIQASIELPNRGWMYNIKVVTERGNAAIYQLTPVIPSPVGAGGGGYPIVIVADHYNFQYAAGIMTRFESAYRKPAKTDNTLYRILLNNTTNKRIILHKNCTMLHMAGKVGQAELRYIVSDQNALRLPPSKLIPFTSQVIDPGRAEYVYFAASTPGGDAWKDEPGQAYWIVGFIITFQYEGEAEIRNISLPSIPQELY
jgi:hypothetical protein